MSRGWEGKIDNYLIKDEPDKSILSKSTFIENFKQGTTIQGTRFSVDFNNREFTLAVRWDFIKDKKGKVKPDECVMLKIYFNKGKQGPEEVYYDKITRDADNFQGPFELFTACEDYVFEKLKEWEKHDKWARQQ